MTGVTQPHRRVVEADGELAGAELGYWLADSLSEMIAGCDGLFTATGTAGATESVGFWSEVTERGARYANPRIFPWTLASAPAGHLALHAAVSGPVVNFVGGADAAVAALESAFDHIDDGLVVRAAVVAFDRDDGQTAATVVTVDAALLRDSVETTACTDAVSAVDLLATIARREWEYSEAG